MQSIHINALFDMKYTHLDIFFNQVNKSTRFRSHKKDNKMRLSRTLDYSARSS